MRLAQYHMSPGDRKTAEDFLLLFTASVHLNKAQFSQTFLRAAGNLYRHVKSFSCWTTLLEHKPASLAASTKSQTFLV